MSKCINIAGRDIGDACAPFIIAEMSANHNGDLNTALRIIEEAKRAGADAARPA
jgi:N-acetylneuraminate synthase